MTDPSELISYIDAFGPEASELNRQCRDTIDAQNKLLCRWRAVAKGLGLSKWNAEISDYDAELASEMVRLAQDTVAATEFPR